jgi:hypothetical protein
LLFFKPNIHHATLIRSLQQNSIFRTSQHLQDFTTNSVVAYLHHASNGIAPGYGKLRIEHLKALSGYNNPLPSADEFLSIQLLIP